MSIICPFVLKSIPCPSSALLCCESRVHGPWGLHFSAPVSAGFLNSACGGHWREMVGQKKGKGQSFVSPFCLWRPLQSSYVLSVAPACPRKHAGTTHVPQRRAERTLRAHGRGLTGGDVRGQQRLPVRRRKGDALGRGTSAAKVSTLRAMAGDRG